MSVEGSPEFQKALREACERQHRGYIYGGDYAKAHSKDKIADTMEEMQRQRDEIEAKSDEIREHAEQVRHEAMIRTHPHMREITKNLRHMHGSGSALVCPLCGEGDQGNRMNGKPVCFMNAKHKGLGPIPLMSPEKAKDWKPPAKPFKRKEPWELDSSEVVRGREKRRQ